MKKKIKCYVLIISEQFPKGKMRAGEKTDFPLKIKHFEKIHTIRDNYLFWQKRFDEIYLGRAFLSVRVWEGKPYNSPQIEIFKYFNEQGIGIEKLTIENDLYKVGKKFIDANILAQHDGLTRKEFNDWFKDTEENREMALIHFTKFRYNN